MPKAIRKESEQKREWDVFPYCKTHTKVVLGTMAMMLGNDLFNEQFEMVKETEAETPKE
jgi:hypothetical protein